MDQLLVTNDLMTTKIHFLRGEKVMLDSDSAFLYGVPTKAQKQAAKRNIDRFPEDFMFRLSAEEWTSLRSQFSTLKTGRGRHSKYAPLAFTETRRGYAFWYFKKPTGH